MIFKDCHGLKSELSTIAASNSGVLQLSHMMDIDGFNSALLIKDAFPNSTVIFSNYDAESLRVTIQELEAMDLSKFKIGVISDIGMNAGTVALWDAIFRMMEDKGVKVVYLDHHIVPKSASRDSPLWNHTYFVVADEDPEETGALLVYKFIYLPVRGYNRWSHKLKVMAESTDLGLFNTDELDGIQALPNAINYINTTGKDYRAKQLMLNWLLDEICKATEKDRAEGREVNMNEIDLVKEYSSEYARLLESGREELLRNAEFVVRGDLRIAISHTTGVNLETSYACDYLREKFASDNPNLLVYLKLVDGQEKTGRLRTNLKSINCAAIAQSFGGGGHLGAAGFPLPESKTAGSSMHHEIIEGIVSAHSSHHERTRSA